MQIIHKINFIKRAAIQILIFVALCGITEATARLWEYFRRNPDRNLQLYLHPYMMFTAQSGGGFIWQNIITNTRVPSTVVFNNYGFAERFNYSLIPDAEYLRQHGKKPGERIVLITGGSVVHGVGATSNDNTIAQQLMRHLNERSGEVRYRVLNIGMGSWIAYQQFIGLSLFGLPFDPDWIVIMDGHNDAAVPCAHGSGAGNPLAWPKFLYLTQGGTGGAQASPLVEAMARHSATVRLISGVSPATKNEIPRGLIFDDSDPDKRFLIKMAALKVAEQDKQIEFYLQAQRNVLALFRRANVILSSQPLLYDNAVSPAFRPTFTPGGNAASGLKADLDRYMNEHSNDACRSQIASQLLGYFMARSALRLTELATEAQATDASRQIIYRNTEAALPLSLKLRERYFIDNAHMSDLGQDLIAEFFAENILAAERGVPFDFVSFAKKTNERAAAGH